MSHRVLSSAIAGAALAIMQPAIAQEMPAPTIGAGNTLLSVQAEGKTSRKPDIAVFSAGVATTGATAGEALSANSAAMNRVLRALKSAGIADRDVQTSNLNVSPVYADRHPSPTSSLDDQMPRIVGYRANNQVTVKQRKLDEFGKVIDTLVSSGANQVNGPDFQIDNADQALDAARRDAITKARSRAQLYASATGMKVGRIISINESGAYSPRPPVVYARMEAADSAGSTPVAAGELELQANVNVTFELIP